MTDEIKHRKGIDRIKKVRYEEGSRRDQEPIPQSDQELVDEISLEIEVKDIMEEVHLPPV